MVDREEIRQRMAMAVPRLMDEECFAEGDRVYPIQNAKTVVRFSSHYGRTVRAGQNSSYSAYNLAGPAGVRTYGDHTAAMVLVRVNTAETLRYTLIAIDVPLAYGPDDVCNMGVCVHARARARVCVCARARACTFVCTCTRECVCERAHVYMYSQLRL